MAMDPQGNVIARPVSIDDTLWDDGLPLHCQNRWHDFMRWLPQPKIMSAQNDRVTLHPAQPVNNYRQPLACILASGRDGQKLTATETAIIDI